MLATLDKYDQPVYPIVPYINVKELGSLYPLRGSPTLTQLSTMLERHVGASSWYIVDRGRKSIHIPPSYLNSLHYEVTAYGMDIKVDVVESEIVNLVLDKSKFFDLTTGRTAFDIVNEIHIQSIATENQVRVT
uniref:tRNA (Cmo5U34)-methyltransferase n=1 Tax=Lygus hesperus TaxID=30085 RepID=A0A0A9Z459_LYGHE